MSEKPLLLPLDNRSLTKESGLQLYNQPLLGQLSVPRDTSQTSSEAEFDYITSYFQPATADEGFNIIRYEPN